MGLVFEIRRTKIFPMAEYFNLLWQDFERSTSTVFKDLLIDEVFTDVTLACDGNQQIRAHKVILMSCSSFFRNILVKNPHERLVIHLKGVRITDLTFIIRFMYLGETEVAQDDLNEFMKAAEGLEIKGLTTGSYSAVFGLHESKEETTNESIKVDTIDKHASGQSGPEDFFKIKNEGSSSKILDVHSDNISPLHLEDKSDFRGQFPCEQCDYKASRADHLKRHIFSVHEKSRINCNLCEFSATRVDNLKRHIQ